jgi:hypothetical protein
MVQQEIASLSSPKGFWRDEPRSHWWPQVLVLLSIRVAMFVIARRLARRSEYS